MNCIDCDGEFNEEEKLKLAKVHKKPVGRKNQCLECASDEPVRYTGVPIYGTKTLDGIQINKDPKLTEYMKDAGGARKARSLGKTSLYTSPKVKNSIVVSAEATKRR